MCRHAVTRKEGELTLSCRNQSRFWYPAYFLSFPLGKVEAVELDSPQEIEAAALRFSESL
jgi:hypothetical protein